MRAISSAEMSAPIMSQNRVTRNFSWAGMVSGVQKKVTQKGDQMAVFTLEDMEGEISCVCFPKVFAAKGRLLFGDVDPITGESTGDVFVKVRANLERSDRGNQLMVMDLEALELNEEDARPKVLELRVPGVMLNQSFIARLTRVFGTYPGGDNVELLVEESGGQTMRAEIPMHVDCRNYALMAEVEDVLRGQGSVVVA